MQTVTPRPEAAAGKLMRQAAEAPWIFRRAASGPA